MAEAKTRTFALVALAVLAALAVADGAWLTVVHIDYETGVNTVASACHSLSEKGCLVTAGRFGSIMGIPVATIGAAGSFAILVLAILALRKKDAVEDPQRGVLLLLCGFTVLASLMMGTFSIVEGSFCPFCVAWYGINIGLFIAAWKARDRSHRGMDLVDDATSTSGFVALGAFVAGLLVGVTAHNRERDSRKQEEEKMLEEHGDEIAAKILEKDKTFEQTPVEIALEGSPSKGPQDAEVVIIEFGDFECPHCKKLWNSMEEYVGATDRKVRVHFANFPLNEACNPMSNNMHPHACAAAVAGVCAERQGRFWDYGQQMFDNQDKLERDDLVGYARNVDLDIDEFSTCLDDPEAMARVKYDIGLAIKHDVTVTPTFYVNGYQLSGAFPVPLLAALIDKVVEHDSK